MKHMASAWKSAVVLGVVLALLSFAAAQNQNASTDSSESKSAKASTPANQSDIAKRIDNSASVFQEIMAAPDNTIPQNILDKARCILVVPNMVKFAVGFGGRHGKGVATCRTAHGWSAPAPVTLSGGSWGLQLGGEAVDLVMLVMNQKGMDHLLSSKFKIGGDVSGAAGPVGRHAEAATNWKANSEILTYSRAKGLFAGIDLAGTYVAQDKDETRVLYGHMIPFPTILNGKVPAPRSAQHFLATIRKYAAEAQTGAKKSPSTPAGSPSGSK